MCQLARNYSWYKEVLFRTQCCYVTTYRMLNVLEWQWLLWTVKMFKKTGGLFQEKACSCAVVWLLGWWWEGVRWGLFPPIESNQKLCSASLQRQAALEKASCLEIFYGSAVASIVLLIFKKCTRIFVLENITSIFILYLSAILFDILSPLVLPKTLILTGCMKKWFQRNSSLLNIEKLLLAKATELLISIPIYDNKICISSSASSIQKWWHFSCTNNFQFRSW